jgi:hypothetical protein
LLYISESEAELHPFSAGPGAIDTAQLLALSGAAKGTAVEEATLEDFFRTVSVEDKPKFDKLAKVLKEQLTGVRVFKVGDEAEKQVFVIGKAGDGQWVGVRTSVVES